MKYSSNKINERKEFKQKLVSKKFDSDNAFEQDALDGFRNSGAKLDLLYPLDKKFRKNNSIYWYSASIIIISFIIYLIIPISNSYNKTRPQKIASIKKITIEKSDILIPEKIENLNQIEAKKSVQIKTLISNFEAQKNNELKKDEESNVNLENPSIEINKLEEIKVEEQLKIKKNTSKAIEIYIHDLLIVDYRKYRSKPEIKTETLLITGTSADKESTNSPEIENTTWKQIDIPYIDYINKTMTIFAKGNYKKALTRCEEILKTYPDDLNANFYGALCYFNLGENQKAFELFSICETHKFNNFEEDAKWYSAKCLINMNKNDQAKILLNEIIENNGFYTKEAKKMLTSKSFSN